MRTGSTLLLAIAALTAAVPLRAQQENGGADEVIHMAPARGFLEAHAPVQDPPALLGGPLEVKLQQTGGVVVALPDHRQLDPNVFGTPDHPRSFGGTPGIDGLPVAGRNAEDGHFTTMKSVSPFGDAHMGLPGGELSLELVDATATDGATTEDQATLTARWKDEDGNTYEVRCCSKLAAHGIEFPTFGGVVTNHLLHGFTRLGTALMPTEFAYAAFWGMGTVSRNGQVLDGPRLIHGMLTEYVRTGDYELAADAKVNPRARHFHLMVPPFAPAPEGDHYVPDAVHTGFTLPNGKELPFWHVMFENPTVQVTRPER